MDRLPAENWTAAAQPAAIRYTLTAQALHWLTALFILAILPVAWVMISLPEGPDRALMFVVHRSLGITILVLIAARLAWRAANPPPPMPGGTSRALEWVGRLTHWLLYGLLILMPVTGYLQSGNGKPVSYFGLFNLPGFPKNKAVDDVAETLHLAGQWGIYALIGLHLLATVWHMAIRRDGLLNRMMPAQDNTALLPPG